jgi:putative tryptophan/tyrosine transport system substrate-binding protein
LKRREFITLLGGAAAWPLVARAQQPAMPVIGYLSAHLPGPSAPLMGHSVKDSGFVEGENVAILYRWAEGQYARLPELAAELVRRRVAIIAATGGVPPTTTIPIVFAVGEGCN